MFCVARQLGSQGSQAASLMTVNIKPLHSLILLSSQSGWENHSSASEGFFYTLSVFHAHYVIRLQTKSDNQNIL